MYIFSLLIFLYVLSRFMPYPIISYTIGILSFAAIIYSFRRSYGSYFVSGLCFFIAGFILFIYNKIPIYTFLLYFESMLGVLSLFLVLPFINSIIRVGKYDKNLSLLLQQGITSLSKLYRRSFLVCHFLALFLNIATIPLLKNSLMRTLQQLPTKTREKFYTQNLLRAYALCLTWSPLEIMVITSLDLTDNNYIQLFPFIIGTTIVLILSDLILATFKHSQIDIVIESNTEVPYKRVYNKMIQMLFMLFLFVTLVTIAQKVLHQGFLFSVVLLLIPVSVLWAFFIGKLKRYMTYTIPHWKARTRGLSNYFFMFLSAGFFVEMLSLSGLLSFLQLYFSSISDQTLLFFFMIALYFLLTSFIGFHPLVSLTLLAELLNPILSSVSSISLTIVLIVSSLSTVMYSPYNLSVSILAEQLKINPYKMGMWNLLFAIYYMLIGISIAYLLTFFI
ncbi:hypothetical protein ACJ2A9_03135 [Anaerobacillus sp. MEB173]|uniref:hypothetical protein n=1 Tax=Anaerobacillus sp. MEB173 TaxID=3383345 RepID=UPI003F8E7609